MVFKKLLIFTLLIALATCTPNWYKPIGYRLFRQMPKGGSPGFNLGWVHGCESGLGTQFGGAIYMNFYTWQRDSDIVSSAPDIDKIRKRYKKELKDVNWNDSNDIKRNFRDYNKIFWSAHAFCRHSVVGTLQAASMDPPLAGEVRYNPAAHHLGSIWKLDGKGDVRIGSKGLW